MNAGFLLACLLPFTLSLPAAAQALALPGGVAARIGTPLVVVAPDQPAWTYSVGDHVTFSVSVLFDGNPLPDAAISYTVGPEKFEGEPVEAVLADGTLAIAGGTLDKPGFLRCTVRTRMDGKTYTGMATAGFDPAGIRPTQSDPADFDAFWEQELARFADLPLDLNKTLLPDSCTADVNVYAVSYATPGNGGPSRFYGILSEPAKPGRYPAVLSVPGAGVRTYHGDRNLAAQGLIVLQVGIHGIPVQLPGSVYDDLRNGALRDYPTFNVDNRDLYYYRRVYLGCVRGNDVLTAHPMWDGKTLVVMGGSQGGQLSIVTSALDKRVTGTVSNYPAYCDVTGYVHGRAGGWPHLFARQHFVKPANLATTAYYDVVNFARRLRAPISCAWGYNDTTCPPTSMHAAYNVITAPKELILQLDMGHSASPEFSTRTTARVLAMAGLR